MDPIEDKVAIIGYDMTQFGDLYQLGLAEMSNMALTGALKTANVERDKIDSLYVGNAGAGQFLGQEHIGSYIATEAGLNCQSLRIEAAGASGAVAMRTAALGVLTGYQDIAAVVGTEKMTSFTKSSDTQYALSTSLDSIWEAGMGATLPGNFAIMSKAHSREFGTTDEQIAQVAVKNHENASKNPRAQFRNLMSVDKVLGSKMLADPIRLFQGTAASDGAASVILADPDIAESYVSDPVYMRASKQSHAPIALHQRSSLAELSSVKNAAEAGYKQLNISPKDIDLAEAHDVFSIGEILAIEALGLVERGTGGKATEDGVTSLDGEIPVNTSGGLKARGHPIGASGVAQAIEILEQFNNDAGDRQLDDIEWGMTQSMGGTGGTAVVSFYSR